MKIKLLSSFLDIFFPKLCTVCQNRLNEKEKYICLHCLSDIPRTYFHEQTNNRLEQMFAGRLPYQRIAAFAYFIKNGCMQKIIHEIKYRNNPELSYYMGLLCGEELAKSLFITDIDYIVAIPLHKNRQKERGYNQSLELVKGIADKTGIPIDDKTVIRTKNNPSQARSDSRFKRWQNVEGIFELCDYSRFRDKHILLVDDVITTGSTLEACAKEILRSKNSKVSIYSLATTE